MAAYRREDAEKGIATLASYGSREEAIKALLDRRFDDYLAWARGDGWIAAFGRPGRSL